jgi:acetyltransferase-like isoleucine patch superfamily enzyme
MKFPRFRRPVSELINWMWERVTWRGIIFPGDRRARRFGAFGDGSLIGFPTGTIYGEKYMHVGSNTIFADHVTLSVGMIPGQEMVSDPVLSIGDDCVIGRGNAIVSHFRIDIGDGVYTGMNVYITDQNHTYDDIDTPIGRQHPVDEPVRIGSGSWIGSGAIILPGADIGEHVVVAANSVVRGTIPANSVVAGVPAKVVRQHDGEAWSRP